LRVDLELPRCILCGSCKPETWEHLIPKFLGGRLQLRILCSNCNNTCGTRLVSGLKRDLGIRAALLALKERIPHIFTEAEKKGCFLAIDDEDRLWPVAFTKGEIRGRSARLKDSEVVLTDEHAKRFLEKELAKCGAEPRLPSEVSQILDEGGFLIRSGELLELSKPCFRHIIPKPEGGLVDHRLPALIAYEFFALLCGHTVYHPGLSGLRSYIMGGQAPAEVQIERYRTEGQYQPFHSLEVVKMSPHLVIDVVFFGHIVLRVGLTNVHGMPYDPVIIEDLEQRRTLIARTRVEARQQIFYELRHRKERPN